MTRPLVTAALRNVRNVHPSDHEEGYMLSRAAANLRELLTLYGDLFDAISRDDTTAAYNEVDTLIDAARIQARQRASRQQHAAD